MLREGYILREGWYTSGGLVYFGRVGILREGWYTSGGLFAEEFTFAQAGEDYRTTELEPSERVAVIRLCIGESHAMKLMPRLNVKASSVMQRGHEKI